MSFIRNFRNKGDISFKGMRDVAMDALSQYSKIKLDQLYEDLDRGKGVLDDDDHLNMYLRSFGKMHREKLNEAFKCVPNMLNFINDEIEIFDWGCGQGTATICLLDYIKANFPNHSVKRITLIDPSKAATNRAKAVISCYNLISESNIRIVVKGFDELKNEDIAPQFINKLHIFSNILDVVYFDLAQFTNLFQKNFNSGRNHFVCVGPFYYNNRRMDDFMAAIDPDTVTASYDKQKGAWINDWTISMRLFSKTFVSIEEVDTIRRRIKEAQKNQQYHAGYILDEVSQSFSLLDEEKQLIAKKLLASICSFDVHSNQSLELPEKIDSKWAVINNIIVRGTPTLAPLEIQDVFSDCFESSTKADDDNPAIWYNRNNTNPQALFEALHLIDPRFSIENYNGDMLGSDFERNFLESKLNGSPSEYLIQLLEPQRNLSTIVSIPDRQFTHDQRVDFALELPCAYGENNPVGFIIEIDGAPYHSNIFQRRKDERRDMFAARNNWDTYRLTEAPNNSFVDNWEQDNVLNKYLQIVQANYKKSIQGEWAKDVQLALSPIAIARIEKVIVEAILSGTLDTNNKVWNIAVIERDVPCAVLALRHLQSMYEKLCLLAGDDISFPNVNLEVSSTKEFKDSPLHCSHAVHTVLPSKKYDICIDISILLRDNIDALPNSTEAEAYYIVRTSHYKKRERVIYSAENISYRKLVEKSQRGEYVELEQPKQHLTYFLQNIFRKREFRKGQLPILNRSLSNKTTIGLLPTGGGKSLIYQLSAVLQPGVTLIVDPLISLMVDQFRGLQEIRIDASACVNSTMDFATKNNNLNRMQNGCLLFIFLSPERFMMENFRESLLTMSRRNHVYFSYGVIDEVHCVSEWGHDFRPSYLHLGRNMINFMLTKSAQPIAVIGLTATASFDVLADVERELTLGGNLTLDSDAIVRPENDTRPELTYKIVGVRADLSPLKSIEQPLILNIPNDRPIKNKVAESKKQVVCSLLNEIPYDLAHINEDDQFQTSIPNFSTESFYEEQTEEYPNAGILFCPHAKGEFGVNDTVYPQYTIQGISSYLIANESERLNIGTFVGGDKPSGDMARFNQNEQNLMVATKAFGMGIDKPNVRYTINFNHPSSIESFVQEAGRAGRDGKNAVAYLLYEPTEYICLTIDKIDDINRELLKRTEYPAWLWNIKNQYILKSDFINLLVQYGASNSEATQVLDLCSERDMFENVDKNIELWFHNNSFRGLYKEKVILHEMTDRILNVKPQNILAIQSQLRDLLGNEDVRLILRTNQNAIIVCSEENRNSQYGFLFLDTLYPTYRFINFEISECQKILNSLIQILRTIPDHSADWLSKPIESADIEDAGIYSAMQNMGEVDYAYVTVTWRNQIDQDFDEFDSSVRAAIADIALEEDWNTLDEERNGKLNLAKIGSFEELIEKIARISGDIRWVQYHAHTSKYKKLQRAFCRKRDKDDTDKAIYRMCCVGLVEDVTIDYNLETYLLKIKKRTDEEYLCCMLDFFKKYYSLEQAERKVEEIRTHSGRNILDKCLGYLAEFVYHNLERKRFRSIDDMRLACEDGMTRGEKWLKEFIHLYFNSKYARDDYRIEDKEYSLKRDTDRNREDFDVVRKYLEAVRIDNSGSEVDNVKHLYGATLLVLRAHPENAALNILRTFCITFLGTGENETLKRDALTGYVDGFTRLHKEYSVGISSLVELLDEFNEVLNKYVHEEDNYIKEHIISSAKDLVLLNIHSEWMTQFANNYCNYK